MLTTSRQMEFVTPEEIAQYLIFEIEGGNTGHDVINALDNAVLGPSYRAGLMRHWALERMMEFEKQGETKSVAFEMLGPPRNTKLLFEAHLLREAGLSAPEVYAADEARGLALIEDLGDALFARVLEATPTAEHLLYTRAVEVLVDLHQRRADPRLRLGGRARGREGGDQAIHDASKLEKINIALGGGSSDENYVVSSAAALNIISGQKPFFTQQKIRRIF